MLNFKPPGFIALIDAHKSLTTALSTASGTLETSDIKAAKDAAEYLRRAIFKNELVLYAVFDEGRTVPLGPTLLDAAMGLETGVLTFSHIGRGSNPPIGLNRKQIDQLARDPLVVHEKKFQKWLKNRHQESQKSNDGATDATTTSASLGVAPAAQAKTYKQKGLRRWYVKHVRKWPSDKTPPNRNQDWILAKEALGWVPKQAVLELRKELAPDVWSAKGRRAKT